MPDGQQRHLHTAECWKRYEPCGEHHPHSYNCGGGELNPSCPHYERDLRWQIQSALSSADRGTSGVSRNFSRIKDCARKLGDDELLGAIAVVEKRIRIR